MSVISPEARVLTDPATGFVHIPGALDAEAQARLLEAVREVVRAAPLFTPRMPRTGKAFSVRMTNAGSLGWVADKQGGYRYQARHPVTGRPWPPMPPIVSALWEAVGGYPAPPEACLINWYAPGAKMGAHKDADEAAASAPVLSISLGDTAVFRLGGPTRREPARRMEVRSGDAVLLAGASRHFYHGIDRVLTGTSGLLPDGGRLNLTVRRVTEPGAGQ